VAKLDFLKREFPVLREKLDFGDFHPELAGNYVEVWLNLSHAFEDRVRQHREQYAAYERRRDTIIEALESDRLGEGKAEELRDELKRRSEEMQQSTAEIYAELWGCTEEEYRQLVTMDAALTTWLIETTWQMIGGYRDGRKKARTSLSPGSRG